MNIELIDVIGLLCNAIAIIFYFMPITNMVTVIKTKDTSKAPWLLFIFTILNSEFWTIYGIKINSWPIYFCNGIGIVTNIIYLSIYFLCQVNRPLWKRTFYISLVLLTCVSSLAALYTYIQNQNLFGGLACMMNIIMYISPLQNLQLVFKNKDNSFIPINISLCLVVNCMLWMTFGFFKNGDYFMIISNVLGLILSLTQCVLWFKFRETSGKLKCKKGQSNHAELKKEGYMRMDDHDTEAEGAGSDDNINDSKI